MKTMAELKRDAAAGRICLEMVERYGKTGDEIPERLRGIRKVAGANSVCIKLLNLNGVESELRLQSAKLMEYTDDTLVIYAPGLRDPTAQEQAVLDECRRALEKYEKENPYSDSPYWMLKEFFKNCECPWMAGNERIRGKRYQISDGKVSDYAVRGDVTLRYNVYRNL